jgi:hypothetical protein
VNTTSAEGAGIVAGKPVAAGGGKIFVSYRRSDDPGFAQALYLRLESEFGGDNVFMDVEGHIKAGDDFVTVLNDQVAQCDVLLAIIGERWVDSRDDNNIPPALRRTARA